MPARRWRVGGAAVWRWHCRAAVASKLGAGLIPALWCSCWACWSGRHVRLGAGDANLFGGGGHGHAQGLRRSLWPGARPVAVRASERACVPVRQRAKESPEAAFLGWERAVGLCQAPGEGKVLLAGDRQRAGEGGTQSRGTCVIVGGHRSGGDTASAMVPEYDSRPTDTRISSS